MIKKLKIFFKKHEKSLLIISFVYLIGVCAYMIIHRSWFSPDQFFAFAIFGALLAGRIKMFLFDWIPFLLFFFGYEFLRGIVPHINSNVHILTMIRIDRFIFGTVPTIKLQQLFYNPNHLQWYDYFLVTCYIAYFVMPMLVGYYFWIKDRAFFKKFSLAFVLLAYACFITFIIFPAMPPWMASGQGYLPPIEEVTGHVMAHFLPSQLSLPTVYQLVSADPVAAFPSLHAAVPTLIFLFLFKKYKKRALLFLPYLFGVWIAVIYLGEHYFTDVLFGAIYATTVFLLVNHWSFIKKKLKVLFSSLAIS
ncbi:MAG TPA: phosphatase PAP2 family protein [Patescibacteria group bacterium]|nr:phosphatase PAP2 family protein [Patescibacteria group bacterium]